MDPVKCIMFVAAAPLLTAVACKVSAMFSAPSPAEIARAQAAAQADKVDEMTATMEREALRQEEQSELAA